MTTSGTAQIAENGVYLQGQYILSFIGAMPMNEPEIAIYVCMEKPHSLIQYPFFIFSLFTHQNTICPNMFCPYLVVRFLF